MRYACLEERNSPADIGLLATLGRSGEELVAKVRVVVCGLLLIVPTYRIVTAPEVPEYRLGMIVMLVATGAALIVYRSLGKGRYNRWLGIGSSVVDVSLVSAALSLFLMASGPEAAARSTNTFEIYFLAITATALRYDREAALVAGATAIGQYILLLWACAMVDPTKVDGPEQITRLVMLGAAVLLAWLLSQRAEQLLFSSNRDSVTALGNRHYFDASVRTEIIRHLRRGRPCALAVIDIDHFKAFNDAHGHKTGDRVLRILAEVLRRGTRASDLIARWGGEEFVVFLPEAECADAVRRLDRLRAAVAEVDLGVKSAPFRCTISAGVTAAPIDGSTLEALFDLADERLLRAKQEGRDRVIGSSSCEGVRHRVTPIGSLRISR